MNKRSIVKRFRRQKFSTLFGTRHMIRVRTEKTEIDPLDYCSHVRGGYMAEDDKYTYHIATIKTWNLKKAVGEIVRSFNQRIGKGKYKILRT